MRSVVPRNLTHTPSLPCLTWLLVRQDSPEGLEKTRPR